MAAALTVPLDDWVTANSRPIKIETLDDLRGYGARRDYSTMTVEDAFSLLYHTCKTCFGDLSALDFSVKELNGPLAYSATLTVTGPDEIGIEFPNSGNHSTVIMAKMHAAHKAVQQGVIAFMMEGQVSTPSLPRTKPNPLGPKNLPSKGNKTDRAPPNPPQVPKKPPPPKTIPVHMGPAAGNFQAASTKPLAKPNKPPVTALEKSPVSIVNELLQKTYSANKLHKIVNSGLRWDQKRYSEGYLARMTVVLPSGKTKSYGSIPDVLPENHHTSKYPLKVEESPQVAKRAVATYAIKLGVLDFIASEDVSGRALASIILPPKPAFLPPKPPVASGSNQIELNVPPVQPDINVGPKPLNHERSSMSLSPIQDAPAINNIQVRNDTSRINDVPAASQVEPTNNRQATNEAQAVDETLEPAQASRDPSPKVGNETFNADVESRHPTRERLGSYEPLGEDDQSEAMELDTDAGTRTRGNSIISNTGRKVSPEMEDERAVEEPPKKKQKTEPLMSPPSEKGAEGTEVRVMNGPSYVDILSAYCVEKGHAQPQVTYQRQLNESNSNAPVVYHVSMIIGTRRYELSKHYESVQAAEEKLSKRILKLFGVRAKKA